MSTSVNSGRTGLGWYLEQIKSTPLLSAVEEKQLARLIREHSDPIARERMIAANLRLVVKIAKEYSSPGMTLADLVAEGNLGLMRAVEEFDPDAGVRFSTYAAWWIKQAIKKALINAGQPIHIPAYLVKLINKWRRMTQQLQAELGRPPNVDEMAGKLKISQKKARIILQGLQAVTAPSQIGSEEAHAISEIVPYAGKSPEAPIMDAANTPFVRRLIDQLDDRLKRILILRFGLDGYDGPQRTYKQIGQMMDLTRERIRQLEKQALTELQGLLE